LFLPSDVEKPSDVTAVCRGDGRTGKLVATDPTNNRNGVPGVVVKIWGLICKISYDSLMVILR